MVVIIDHMLNQNYSMRKYIKNICFVSVLSFHTKSLKSSVCLAPQWPNHHGSQRAWEPVDVSSPGEPPGAEAGGDMDLDEQAAYVLHVGKHRS